MKTSERRSFAGQRLRRAWSCAVLAALLLAAVPAAPAVHATSLLGVGLIPTESGVGDLAFNWLAYQGLLRAEADLHVEGTVYTPSGPDDYAVQLQACVDDGNALCISIGFSMADATWAAAQANPGTHFAVADMTWDTYLQNLRGMAFAVEQAAYLAGVLVAGMTEADVVSVVGGMAIPPVVAFVDPYTFGAQCTNPVADVRVGYAGTFADPDAGAYLAMVQMMAGSDAIFGCGGLTGNGAILFAAQNGAWAVGVDTDQWLTVFDSGNVDGSERLLTSVMKRIDNAVYDTIADEAAGAFTPGTATYDLAAGGVGLAPYHEAEPFIPQAVKDAVETARERILEGSLDPWQPCKGRILPAWRQSNSDGFGDPANAQIPSLEVFGDWLYAGTWNSNAESEGWEIWRTAAGSIWQQVAAEPGNGAADLAVFDGFLYAGTWDGAIWRSPDGLVWAPVVEDGFGDPGNGIARFAVYNGMLYATTWNDAGTEVWRSGDGETWTPFGDGGLGDPANIGAISSAPFGSYLYVGIDNEETGAQLWRTDGTGWEQVMAGGFGDPANAAVSSLAEFHGYLYAGMWNEGGVQVWRYTAALGWQQVVGGGFGNPSTNMANALEVLDGMLYLVAHNEEKGLEVWRTANGTAWEQAGFGGFGDANNTWSYWDNATTVFRGSLYVATNNLVTGGEVWQTFTYRAYMPLALRSY